MNCENINPYDDRREKGEQVKDMFDSIAPAYDFMNRAMTLGIDRRWRSIAIGMLDDRTYDHILDIATGTADLAILMAHRLDPIDVVGVDLSEKMLAKGRRKIEEEDLTDTIRLTQADCMQLPFPDETFDLVTCAFGVRNFEHLSAGYREMYRVLRPGGSLCIIELSTPTSKVVRPLYNLYTRHIIPTLGRAVSSDRRAYTYLPESIEAVPQGSDMTALMERAGFTDCTFRPLTFGVCTVYIAKRN